MGRGRGSRFWESVLRSCRDRKALKKSEPGTGSSGLTLWGGQTYCEACQKCSGWIISHDPLPISRGDCAGWGSGP